MNLDGPAAYFITFRTYGTWLHGDERGATDRHRNVFGHDFIEHNEKLEQRRRDAMRQPSMLLTDEHRRIVDSTIREVCTHRGWVIRCLNVRTNHVHLIVEGSGPPEKMLGDFKRWSTRRLREQRMIDPDRLVWSVHGSTKYLWNPEDLDQACTYVAKSQ